MAPKVAIRAAPTHVKIVPTRENGVKDSPSMRVANAVLKTRPDACNVERTGKGRVVICMVLPIMFDITNINMPNCHLRLL